VPDLDAKTHPTIVTGRHRVTGHSIFRLNAGRPAWRRKR
jgi:hypothetical protein